MDQKERKQFWDVLCSLNGVDIQSESEKLARTIKTPRLLYRYRSVSLKSIDALQRNRMHFSNANYYDDPFDTLIKINFDRIRDEARKILSSDQIRHQLSSIFTNGGKDSPKADSLITFLDNTDHELIIDVMVDCLKRNIQSYLKSKLWTACFTESGDNETMWLKYADQYKGFCLIYDLQDPSRDLCGKQEKCFDCVVNNAGVSLYPVYYSDEGYDATEYAKNLVAVFMADSIVNNNLLSPEVVSPIIPPAKCQVWQPERITLIKSKCHEYDQEWRLILRDKSNTQVMKEWIPAGVILGLKVSNENRELIIRSAKMAGIVHIYESYINDNYNIDHKLINYS